MKDSSLRVAVLLPAYNEAASIVQTIKAFSSALPDARIYVCDNASLDDTARLARAAGATVYEEPRKGKGYAVKRLFAVAQADIYVLCDADLTYDATAVPAMIEALRARHLDMVTGVRQAADDAAFRAGHRFGNRLFNWLFTRLFGYRVNDVFSGLRIMSRRFVKSLPVGSSGFEIETELTATAAAMRLPCAEMPIAYGARPEGSVSKLRTYRDGTRILFAFFNLFREYRPIPLFGGIGALLFGVGLTLGLPLVLAFIETGLVLKFPTAILVMGLIVMSVVSCVTGLILDSVARLRLENRQLVYLQILQQRRGPADTEPKQRQAARPDTRDRPVKSHGREGRTRRPAVPTRELFPAGADE